MFRKNTNADKVVNKTPQRNVYAIAKCTRVIVKYDAGWGKALFIRGRGTDGLNWERGIPMQNIDCDEWLWEKVVPKGDIEFKILVNDEIWCQGENFTVHAGESKTVRPIF